ncbi:3D domain-containing protein [Patescibacteria group bacterium]|nr:3D domain-containing protein [Patescibacteria group bacterium]MCL5114789.1 3D domain-containing protein [Patescibacteria group bacterium]
MKASKINVLLVLALVLIPLKMLNTADRVDAAGMSTTTVTSTVSQAVYTPQNTLSVWVTAYASVPEETDDTPFITASNKHVKDGFLAANFLPFGTKVTIPSLFGDKVFTVEDRMSKRKTGFVDVWMPSVSDAKDFGIHKAQIVIVGDAIAGNVASR